MLVPVTRLDKADVDLPGHFLNALRDSVESVAVFKPLQLLFCAEAVVVFERIAHIHAVFFQIRGKRLGVRNVNAHTADPDYATCFDHIVITLPFSDAS